MAQNFDLRPEARYQIGGAAEIRVGEGRFGVDLGKGLEVLLPQGQQLTYELVCGLEQRVEVLINKAGGRFAPLVAPAQFQIGDVQKLHDEAAADRGD